MGSLHCVRDRTPPVCLRVPEDVERVVQSVADGVAVLIAAGVRIIGPRKATLVVACGSSPHHVRKGLLGPGVV